MPMKPESFDLALEFLDPQNKHDCQKELVK